MWKYASSYSGQYLHITNQLNKKHINLSHYLPITIYSGPKYNKYQRNDVCTCLSVLYLTYQFSNDFFLTFEQYQNLKGKNNQKNGEKEEKKEGNKGGKGEEL